MRENCTGLPLLPFGSVPNRLLHLAARPDEGVSRQARLCLELGSK